MDITGKIIVLEDEVQVSDKFRKREFVIEYATNPQYPEFIKFELVQDKCGMLANYSVGQEVQVFFDLRGRKWVDRQGNERLVPLYLVVFILPDDRPKWLEVTADELILRKEAFWYRPSPGSSLRPSDSQIRIEIPFTQRLAVGFCEDRFCEAFP